MSDELSTVSDVRLFNRIVARDAAAVGVLYDRHSRLLFGVIMRILRNRSDAEEVLQEVFLRVWTRADQYDERAGTARAWLARLARNRAIDVLRARRVRRLDTSTAVGPQTQTVRTSVATVEDEAVNHELRAAIHDALAGLPGEQRTLVSAAFFEGYTHGELARRFGLPLGTVKTRIRTAMLALRHRLEQAT